MRSTISMLIVKSENCGLLGRHFLIKRSWFSAYFFCLRRYFEIFAKKTFKFKTSNIKRKKGGIQVNKKTFTKMMLEVGMVVFTNTSAKSIETNH